MASPLVAAFENNLGVLKKFSAQELDCHDAEGRSPLHFAVAGNHAECLNWLLSQNSSLLDKKDVEGSNGLHTAAYFGSEVL